MSTAPASGSAPAPPSSSSAPPAPPNPFVRLAQVWGVLFIAGVVAGLLIYLIGTILSDSDVVKGFFGFIGLSVVVFAGSAAFLPIKPIYLTGEGDQWYLVLGWDNRLQGFLPTGRMTRIKPAQQIRKWVRVGPVMIKHDMQVYTGSRDLFDVHFRVMLRVNPSDVRFADAQGLYDLYRDNLIGMVRATIEDMIVRKMRTIHSFTQVAEERGIEGALIAAINNNFAYLEGKGIQIIADQTFIDIMVPKEVLAQRIRTRADLTELQVIRNAAHELGIPITELLVQQVLSKLTSPQRTARISQQEVMTALEILGRQSTPPNGIVPPEMPSVQPPAPPPPLPSEYITEEPPLPPEPPKPTTYIEGNYRYSDEQHPNDPDGNAPTKYVSPF